MHPGHEGIGLPLQRGIARVVAVLGKNNRVPRGMPHCAELRDVRDPGQFLQPHHGQAVYLGFARICHAAYAVYPPSTTSEVPVA